MDTAQWPQGNNIGVVVNKPSMEASTRSNGMIAGTAERRATRPQKDQALNCPRCNSTNTKFCYYNNYSLSQPRYFCKTCRRYWTEGGSLRNVPVGGGSRKNKRSSSSSLSSTPSSSKKVCDMMTPLGIPSHENTNKIHQGQDLNLGYPPTNPNSNTSTTSSSHISAMELLKSSGITASRGLMSTFMQMPVVSDSNNTMYAGGFSLQDFKPTLNFSLDGFENGGYGSLHHHNQGVEESGARLLFPMEDMKQQVQVHQSSNIEFEHDRGHGGNTNSSGYWTGMLGGGSW